MAHVILSHEETQKLIKEAQDGSKEAMDYLVEHNTRMVWSVVQRFNNRGHPLEDLFQVAVIGLMKGIERFDTEYGVKFSTYAIPMMSGEVQRYVRDTGRVGSIRAPRSVLDMARNIRSQELENLSPEEISRALETDNIDLIKDSLKYINENSGSMMSLEHTVFDNDGSEPLTLEDMLEGDVNGDNWFDYIALHEAIEHLTEREQKIIRLRYFEDSTQVETAKELGVSQVQVSRLESKILPKLKKLIETKEETNMAKAKGNREEAVKLLEATSMTYKEISDETGVPEGTVGYLGLKHRSESVRKQNLVESARENQKKKRKAPTVTVKDEDTRPRVPILKEEEPKPVQRPQAAIVEVEEPINRNARKGKGTVVSFNFNLDVTGAEVSKDEAIEELRSAADLLEHVQTDKVTFKVRVGG